MLSSPSGRFELPRAFRSTIGKKKRADYPATAQLTLRSRRSSDAPASRFANECRFCKVSDRCRHPRDVSTFLFASIQSPAAGLCKRYLNSCAAYSQNSNASLSYHISFACVRSVTSTFAARFGASETDQSLNEFDSCIAGIHSESY